MRMGVKIEGKTDLHPPPVQHRSDLRQRASVSSLSRSGQETPTRVPDGRFCFLTRLTLRLAASWDCQGLEAAATVAWCSDDTTPSHESVYFLEAVLGRRDVVSDRRRID